MLHTTETYIPAKEGCTSFEGNFAFLRKKRDMLQGIRIVERFMQLQYINGIKVQI